MMKTNKFTLIVMGLALASLFASCKKDNENTDVPVDGKGFVAYTEQGGGNTRTHGVPNGNTIVVNWTEKDAILVANQSGEGDTLTYTLTGGYDSTVGAFHSSNEDNSFLTPDYVVIYPAKNAEGTKNLIDVTSDGIIATFTLPATQTYLANSFAEKSMPMVAYSDNQTLQFKNVLGGLCFPMTGGVAVTKIELTSADATESLWGTCATKIGSNGGDPVSVVSNDATGKNIITLDCGEEGVQLGAETPTDFYIMVPAGTLESGFTVTAYNGTDVVFEKSTNSAPGAGFISRNTVRKVSSSLEVVINNMVDGHGKGLFSVAEGRQVYFSQGNLQYQGSTATWRFAEHQWDYVGNAAGNTAPSESQTGWIDLFGWGTSGWNNGNDFYQPYNTSNSTSSPYTALNGYGYGPYTGNCMYCLTGNYANADWGVYNNIQAGEITIDAGTFRTLTNAEWTYLFQRRTNYSRLYGCGTIDGVQGLVILPDDWTTPPSGLSFASGMSASNSYTLEEWSKMEAAGAIFLPSAGNRYGTSVYSAGSTGFYWSSTCRGSDCACHVDFSQGYMVLPQINNRYLGESVRLVMDKNPDDLETPLNVTTISPTFITMNSALALGMVDYQPVRCGFVYADVDHLGSSYSDYFHIGESDVVSVEATTVTTNYHFESPIASLTSDQVYYVRAWAEDAAGEITYGIPVPFATRFDYFSNTNKGKSRGIFSVGENTQVRFSMGNLQYIGSAGNGDANNTGAYWKFAENQYEILGNNGQGSADVAVDRDLFGWGTSGINDYSPIATCYQPWSTSVNSGDYNPYGSNTTSLSSNSGKADWGYNPISNGGNTSGQWRTMTGGSSSGEWYYLLFSRDVTYRFAKANLLLQGTSSSYVSQTYGHPACGTAKPGLILFPDSFSFSTIVRVLNCNGRKDSMSVNIVPEAEWSLLEQAGCIFLPTTGSRDGTTAQWFSSSGFYWSSSYYSPPYAYNLRFDADLYMTANVDRYHAKAVRLVCDAN